MQTERLSKELGSTETMNRPYEPINILILYIVNLKTYVTNL